MHRNTCLYPTIYGILLNPLNPAVPFLLGLKSTWPSDGVLSSSCKRPRTSSNCNTECISWLGRPIRAQGGKKKFFMLLRLFRNCSAFAWHNFLVVLDLLRCRVCSNFDFWRRISPSLMCLRITCGGCAPPPSPAHGSLLAQGPGAAIQRQSGW